MDGTVSERPTMAQAFASDIDGAESLPAESSSVTPAVDASADAIVPPAEAVATSDPVTPADAPLGEPPKERWPDILQNTRAKTRAEVEAEFRQRLGWAEAIDPDSARFIQTLGQVWQTAPENVLGSLVAEIRETRPHLLAGFRSALARELAARGDTPEALPDYPIIDQQGQQVASLAEVIQRHVSAALEKEVGPLKQSAKAELQKREALELTAKAESTAQAMYQQAQAWPGFTQHEQVIGQTWAAHPEWSLQDAYIAVAVPKLQAVTKAQTLDELKTHANASTVNPAAAAVPSTHRPTSLLDKSLEW